MSNNKLRPALMLRVQACAILFMASNRDRIQRIADAKGIELDQAALMYTLGALKRAKRQGTARNYTEAIEQLEYSQVGDRGNPITKTAQADKVGRYISRINRINNGDVVTIEGVRYVNDYNNIVVIEGDRHSIPHYATIKTSMKQCKTRNVGAVLGTLYANWEAHINKTKLENSVQEARVSENLRLFFSDYQARLSNTSQKRVQELIKSDISPSILMGKGKESDDMALKRLSWQAYRLYEGFPHKDAVTGCQFIELLRGYIDKAI